MGDRSTMISTAISWLKAETLLSEEIRGEFSSVSLRLKRNKGSFREYVVLNAPQEYPYRTVFELDEFDRLIEAADAIRELQSATNSTVADTLRARLIDMITAAETVRSVEIRMNPGRATMTLRLMCKPGTRCERIVLSKAPFGWKKSVCWFDVDQFQRFVAAAKRIRAATLPKVAELLTA